MDYDIEVRKLSEYFIADYPEIKYPELMHKMGRPYSCLLVDTHSDYLICIPFRSQINHGNSFLFRESKRSLIKKSGLDYSKIVLIKDLKYIANENAVVDQDEYNEVRKNLDSIVSEVTDYIDDYIGYITGVSIINTKQYDRRYRYSTLPYFHYVMGLSE